MTTFTRRDLLALLRVAPAAAYSFGEDSGVWISLFDGKSLDEWKASEQYETSELSPQ